MPKKKNSTPIKDKGGAVKKKRSQAQMEDEVGPLKTEKSTGRTSYRSDEVSSGEIQNVFADVIQEVTEELKSTVDRVNAKSVAYIIVGEVRYKHGVRFFEAG